MLSLHERIGQMFLVGFHGLTAPDYLLDWLRQGRVGGVILFNRNVESPAQLAALTRQIHEAAKYPALISIDQEGGIVARLRDGFSESPGAMALSSAENGEALAQDVCAMLGRELRALGINWNYAPVVDITYNAGNPALGVRSYGTDKARVGAMAAASIRGFQSADVAATAKHFPGLGNTPIDTHLALPVLDDTVEQLTAHDLAPYRDAISAGVASIMTTHTIYSALDADLPATLSPVIIHQLLRDLLRYDGLVTTDCMEMKAITDHHPPAQSAVLAALAGVDVILFSHTREKQEEAFDGLLQAVESGQVPMAVIDEANRRISAIKSRFAVTETPDLSVIRSDEHRQLEQTAARAGLTLVRADDNAFPLPMTGKTGIIEFFMSGDSLVYTEKLKTGVTHYAQLRHPEIDAVALAPTGGTVPDFDRALSLAGAVDTLVIVTRSAHLYPDIVARVHQLAEAASRVVLVAARNPFDAGLFPEIDAVLCTCSDGAPSLKAAASALFGDFTPTGTLPLDLEALL